MTAHAVNQLDPDAWRQDRVGAARRGENPTVIARLPSGFVAIGDTQFLPGYCVLLADNDDAEHLSDLPRAVRNRFLADMGLLGEAMMIACAALDPALSRINYEILGNGWRRLHAHLFPRYTWEPPEQRSGPVWWYPRERWTDPADALGPEHDRLAMAIARELAQVVEQAAPPGEVWVLDHPH